MNNYSNESLFSDKMGYLVFSVIMLKNRFKFVIVNVRFDDEEMRRDSWSSDCFVVFWELFEMFNV